MSGGEEARDRVGSHAVKGLECLTSIPQILLSVGLY